MPTIISSVKTLGGCMRPLITSDSMVIIEQNKSYKPGDVILFEKDGKKFVHRILSLYKNGFITADDRGLTTPIFIPFESVIGRCVVRPSGIIGVIYGYLSRFIFRLGRFIKKLIFYVDIKQ